MIRYDSVQDLVELAEERQLKISEIVLADQAMQMGISEETLYMQMEKSFDTMTASTRNGLDPDLKSISGLTGGEGAKVMSYSEREEGGFAGEFFTRAVARGMATANCNAAMGKIVASPTAGSCGIIPGALVTLYEDRKFLKHNVVMSLFTAGAFGMIIANKASISGAEGGCQAECGSASGMAAAALVELQGGSPKACADALGMALVNQMGLICDPVAGLVEIPCIKRNAAGVSIAICSATMALAGVELHIPADECIQVMKSVGDHMNPDFKETAKGGLATSPTGLSLKERIFGPEK